MLIYALVCRFASQLRCARRDQGNLALIAVQIYAQGRYRDEVYVARGVELGGFISDSLGDSLRDSRVRNSVTV
jgi:hypothetical protein